MFGDYIFKITTTSPREQWLKRWWYFSISTARHSPYTVVRVTKVQWQGVGGYEQPPVVMEIINGLLGDLGFFSWDSFNVWQGTFSQIITKCGSRRLSTYMHKTSNMVDASPQLKFGSTVTPWLTYNHPALLRLETSRLKSLKSHNWIVISAAFTLVGWYH